MIPLESLDDEWDDQESGEGRWIGTDWHRIVHRYSLELGVLDNTSSLPMMSHAESIEEIQKFPYETYAYEFDRWEDILGLDLLFVPDEHASEYAAYLIGELVFFGYDQNDHDKNSDAETEELKRRIDEYNQDPESHSHPVDLEKMLGEDGYSQEVQEEQARFSRELIVKNYNLEVDQYNDRIRSELEKRLKEV